MNAENNDHIKDDGAWEALHEAFNTEIPEHLEKQLQKSLNGFRRDLREHPYVRKPERPGFALGQKVISFFLPLARPLILAGVGFTGVIIIASLILGNKPPTWAEVQKRFSSMPFFAASIYQRDVMKLTVEDIPQINPLIEPKFIEIWAGYGNRTRIRSGSKLTFAEKGEIVKTFDLIDRREDYADSRTYHIVNTLGKSKTNALDSLLMGIESKESPFKSELIPEWFSKKWKTSGLVDTTSIVVSDRAVSKDLVVFDHEVFYENYKLSKARVWALRESRLPIRLTVWRNYRRNGQHISSPSLDVVFTYSKEQPEDFFDPEVFAAKLKDPSIDAGNLMYIFRQDPVGDSIPPPGT